MSKIIKSAGPTYITCQKDTHFVGKIYIFGVTVREGITDPTGVSIRCLKIYPVRVTNEDIRINFPESSVNIPLFAIIEPERSYDTEVISLSVEREDLYNNIP